MKPQLLSLTALVPLSPSSSSSSSSTKIMCQTVALQVASNQDVHQVENKTAEMIPASDLVPAIDADNAGEEAVGLLENDAPPPEQQKANKTGAGASTFSLPKLAELREKLAGVNTASAVVAGLSLVGSAVGAYFLWPAAAGVAAAGATMKAPGAAGFLISRAAFLANPQLYFQILRTAGVRAAAAAFAL